MIKQFQLSFLSWLAIPLILAYISVNYLLSNVLTTRWHLVVNANSPTSVKTVGNLKMTKPLPSPIPSYQWNGEALVTFWFDDAWISQYETAYPILDQNNFKAAVAIPTQLIGFDDYMNWYQIRKLQYLGWEMTSHSQIHNCDIDTLSDSELNKEVVGSKVDLAYQGVRNDIYVLPCGAKNQNVLNLIKDNYKSLRTVERGLNSLPLQDKNQIKIIEVNHNSTFDEIKNNLEETKLKGAWIILVFHQISDQTSPFAITPELFNQIVEQVKLDSFQVVRPSEALSI